MQVSFNSNIYNKTCGKRCQAIVINLKIVYNTYSRVNL